MRNCEQNVSAGGRNCRFAVWYWYKVCQTRVKGYNYDENHYERM